MTIKWTVATWAATLGARKVKVEPRQRGERKHWDGEMIIGGHKLSYDVTVRNSCAPSHVARSKNSMKEFFEEAEREKHDIYDALAEAQNTQFFAIVVDVHGGFGPDALKFFQELIKLGNRVKGDWTPHQVVHGIYRSIAADICRGNEQIFDTNLEWNLGDDQRRPRRRRR